jgi:hypothetical protein
MSIDLLGIFKRPTFTARPSERQLLTVPVHERIDKAESQPVLATAAAQVAGSGLVWKWVCYDGTSKLCSWDGAQKVFLRGSLNDWILFFGSRWAVKDTNGVEYRGPSLVVADRLLQAVLKHPALPIATWALQLQRKREAAK